VSHPVRLFALTTVEAYWTSLVPSCLNFVYYVTLR